MGSLLLQACRDLSVETDINVRWEAGTPHHPRSVEIMAGLEELDVKIGGDYFCFKTGGDGDNGEHLMYLLDMFFEAEERASVVLRPEQILMLAPQILDPDVLEVFAYHDPANMTMVKTWKGETESLRVTVPDTGTGYVKIEYTKKQPNGDRVGCSPDLPLEGLTYKTFLRCLRTMKQQVLP